MADHSFKDYIADHFYSEFLDATQAARDNAIRYFIETLERQIGVITEFDEALWGALLDHAEIFEKGKVRFCFKNGITV